MMSPVDSQARLPRLPWRTGAAVHSGIPNFGRSLSALPPRIVLCEAKQSGAQARSRGSSLLLNCLDRHGDSHIVRGRGLVFCHTEFRALDARPDFGAARRLFGRRMNGTPEVGDGDRHRFGHTAYGQVAIRGYDAVAVELQAGRLEGDHRKLGDVEIV